MKQSIEYLPPSQAQQLALLFETVWPDQNNHGADIRWAFQSSPLGAGILLVTRAEGTSLLTGARGSIPWPLCQANGNLLLVHQLHGTCVHPEFRRLGLFTQLTQAFLQQLEENSGVAVFNVSVAASRAGYEKLGWTYLPGLQRYLYIARPLAFIEAMFSNRGRLRATFETVCRPNHLLTPWSDLKNLAEIREKALANTHHTLPDEEWLRWRYSREDQGYRFVYQADVGWCSYHLRRSNQITEVLLGDVWLANGTTANVRALLNAVTRAERPTLISILLSRRHPWRQAFVRSGFLPDWKGDLHFGVRLVNDTAHDLLDASRWALMTADIDTF